MIGVLKIMADLDKQPIQFEISGQVHQFEYGLTVCHIYRYEVDQPFNHIEAVQHGTQRAYIFNCPRAIMFLSGQPLPNHDMKPKALKHLTTAMDATVGWEADLFISDEAPEDIKERYIKISTAVLRQEVVVIPESWNEA
jgi:hypothetical protein